MGITEAGDPGARRPSLASTNLCARTDHRRARGATRMDIPTDPASIFVYILLVACIIGVWRMGRPSKKGPQPPQS